MEFRAALVEVMFQHFADEKLKASTLHLHLSISRSALHYKMNHSIGQTPASFIRLFRIAKALDMLNHTNDPIKSIAFQVGFRDPNYFSRIFKQELGLSPTKFRACPRPKRQ